MPAPEGEILFAWVHLSDLHIGRGEAGEAHGRRLVLSEIARDLGRGSWPKIDAIFVTGNVAWTGAKSEYDDARTILGDIAHATGLGLKQVYVVPGEHDIDPKAADRSAADLLTLLRLGHRSLDDALQHDRDRLAQSSLAYLAFAADLAPGCADLFWVKSIDERVRLVGLNTALLADGGEDRGKLRLGTAQLAKALLGPDGDLIVVLSHHPFRDGWLADEGNADKWIASHAHLHLFGHGDRVHVEEARSGGGGHFVRIAAGGRGYSVGAIVRGEDGELAVRVWPRRWSEENKEFREDVEEVPRGEHFVERKLREGEGEKERRGAGTRSRKKAVWEGAGGVPIAEVPHFLGRDDEMKELRAALAKDEAVCVVATGLGGIGKTSLVRQLVAKHGAEMFPDGSVWIDAMSLDSDVARVCKRFGYEGERPRTLVEGARFLANALHEQRALVVIDNVPSDLSDVSALPVAAGKARTVIISRSPTLHESLGVPAKPIALGRWSLEACRSCIREVVPSLAGAPSKDMDALAEFVGRLPLAVRLLARSLQRQGTPASLLARLEAAPIDTLDKVATGADRGVSATFKLAYDDLGEPTRKVLLALAACARISSERVVARVAGMSDIETADALAELWDRSLADWADREAGLWAMHDVVRFFVRAQPGIEQADDAHLAFGEEHVEAHQDPLDWQAMEAEMGEVLAAVDRLLGAGGEARAAKLLERVARHLMQRGRYAELASRYGHLVARLPEGSEELAAALGNAGLCQRRLGDIPKAIDFHQRNLVVYEALGDKAGQARQLGNLGLCHYLQRDFPKAIEHHQRSLAIEEELGRLEGQAADLGNLALCYRRLGDIPRAIECYERALSLHGEHGERHDRASLLGGLGICYGVLGDTSKALEQLRRALTLDEELGHLEGQATHLHNLGNCHEAEGDLPRALDCFQRALAIVRRMGLPDHHPNVRVIVEAIERVGTSLSG